MVWTESRHTIIRFLRVIWSEAERKIFRHQALAVFSKGALFDTHWSRQHLSHLLCMRCNWNVLSYVFEAYLQNSLKMFRNKLTSGAAVEGNLRFCLDDEGFLLQS